MNFKQCNQPGPTQTLQSLLFQSDRPLKCRLSQSLTKAVHLKGLQLAETQCSIAITVEVSEDAAHYLHSRHFLVSDLRFFCSSDFLRIFTTEFQRYDPMRCITKPETSSLRSVIGGVKFRKDRCTQSPAHTWA